MHRLTARKLLVRAAALVGAASMLAMAGGTASASASASSKITAKYAVTGSTYLKSVSTTMALGPGTLTTTVNLSSGQVSANLSLPPATASFKELGLVPVTATTEFLQDGRTTGTINLNTGSVHTTSKITLKLTSLTIAGLAVPVGSSCESSSPATVKLASQPGFNVLKGGKLDGTYTIPSFAHCGLVTPVLNVTIPGSGNTITLKLGKAKI